MSDPKENPGYVDEQYLQKTNDLVAPFKKRSYELMRAQSGHHVLDLGCGSGIDTIPLAKIVGKEGKVIGVDYDEEMIVVADKYAQEAGVSHIITHQIGDAHALEFDDNTFDASRCERVFQHLSDPDKALAEMVRVTKPGGWVVVVDTDHSSISIDTPHTELEWIMRKNRTETYLSGYSGRQLYRQLKQAGLENVEIEACPMLVHDYQVGRYIALMDEVDKELLEQGLVTQEDLKVFYDYLFDLDQKGMFFGYGLMFGASGQKAG